MGKNGVKIDELTSKTNAYENAERFMTESLNDNSDAIKANSDWVGKLNVDYKVTQEVMDALTKSFEDATSKINVYQSILTELNSKEGLSAKSKQDIIAKHQELLPYLGNEVELRKRLIEIIAKEEQVQRQAYANMIMDNEAFFNSKIKGNSILVDKLGEFYTKDLENAKSLADAKLMVEAKLIQTMAKQWAKFYQTSAIAGEGYVQVMGAGGMIDSTGSNMAQNMANELRKVSGLFNDVALSVGGVDLKGINLSDTKGPKGSKGSKSKEENKALEEALKLLEHKKKMSVENLDSLKAEVTELKRINSLYAKSNDEKMDMAERIYAAEKRFMDRRLQDSVNWINDKKNMNELSADEEIAAWERVKNNQSDNIEAVKQATLNLYKLKEQVMLDAYNQEEKHIQHLTKLGTLNTEEQLKAYEKLYSFKAQSIDEEYSRIENLHALNKKIDEERETARKEWISKENGLYDDQQNRLQALASIQETIIQIIRKRGEEEKKALDVAHNAEMDSLEKRHNERKKKSQEDLDLYKKSMQAKIDEYDKQNTEEDYQEQLQKEKEKADEIQREIDMRSLDNSLVSKDKVVKLRKQLAEQVEKISKMQQTRERDLIKKSLQDSLKGYEDSTKEKEDIADKNYDNEKKRLEENYQISKEFLERKYSDEKIYSEARESIMRGTVEVAKGQFEDIYDAYQSFEDKFGKGMGVLGDIIKSDFTKQLEIAQQAIDQLDYKASNLRKKYDNDYQPSREDGYNDPYPDRPSSGGSSSGSSSGKLSSMSKTDYEVYINMKKLWEDSNKKGDQTYMDYANKRANEIRSKYGISSDNYSYDQLKNMPYDELKIAGYDTGGIIPRDGFIMAHEKELYLNSQHQNHLWNFINDLPQMRMPDFSYSMPPSPPSTLQPNITLKIENQIRIDGNVTSEALPEIKELVLDANQDLVNKLNKSGTFRPKY